jgi:hypothetical protein
VKVLGIVCGTGVVVDAGVDTGVDTGADANLAAHTDMAAVEKTWTWTWTAEGSGNGSQRGGIPRARESFWHVQSSSINPCRWRMEGRRFSGWEGVEWEEIT